MDAEPHVRRDRRHPWQRHWAEEGLATYLEPIIRARAGLLRAERVWRDLVLGLRQGQPRDGDEGLDVTHTWGRTYWGGAMFWFLGDVEIRERTNNVRSLDNALRGILDAGGTIAQRWRFARALEVADRALGGRTLEEFYARMAHAAAPRDLDSHRQTGPGRRGRRPG